MKYYLDTSIWMDFFERRNDQNLPKGIFAKRLLEKIVAENSEIIYSDALEDELFGQGYSWHELQQLLEKFEKVLSRTEATDKQIRRAKNLSSRMDVPLLDAIHALIARDSKAIMITRDNHFRLLKDVIESKKPEELI